MSNPATWPDCDCPMVGVCENLADCEPDCCHCRSYVGGLLPGDEPECVSLGEPCPDGTRF